MKAMPLSLRRPLQLTLFTAGLIVLGVLVWQGITAAGNPDPTIAHLSHGAAVLDTAILVFREGLETILVWLGLWLAVFPNVQALVAQCLAALIVIGSYVGAQYLRVWRPRHRGATPAQRAETAPTDDIPAPSLAQH